MSSTEFHFKNSTSFTYYSQEFEIPRETAANTDSFMPYSDVIWPQTILLETDVKQFQAFSKLIDLSF